jgi:hypothetical protein
MLQFPRRETHADQQIAPGRRVHHAARAHDDAAAYGALDARLLGYGEAAAAAAAASRQRQQQQQQQGHQHEAFPEPAPPRQRLTARRTGRGGGGGAAASAAVADIFMGMFAENGPLAGALPIAFFIPAFAKVFFSRGPLLPLCGPTQQACRYDGSSPAPHPLRAWALIAQAGEG